MDLLMACNGEPLHIYYASIAQLSVSSLNLDPDNVCRILLRHCCNRRKDNCMQAILENVVSSVVDESAVPSSQSISVSLRISASKPR